MTCVFRKTQAKFEPDLSGAVVVGEDVLFVRAAWHEQRSDHHCHDRNHDGIPEARVDVASLCGDRKRGGRHQTAEPTVADVVRQ